MRHLLRPIFYFVLFTIVAWCTFEQETKTYQLHWFTYLGFATIVLADMALVPTVGYLAAICFSYTVISGLWIGLWRLANPMQLMHLRLTGEIADPVLQMSARYYSLDTTLRTVLIVIPICLLAMNDSLRIRLRTCIVMIHWFAIISTMYAIYQRFFDPDMCSKNMECGGILMNPSMGACMVAVIAPLFAGYGKKSYLFGLALAIIAAVLSKSSIAYGLVFAQVTFIVIRNAYWYLMPLPPLLGIWAYMILGGELLNDSNRIRTWKFFMDYWKYENHWLGTGAGTFAIFSSTIQTVKGNFDNAWWIWLHNDWLQILFEHGYIGLSLYVSLFVLAVYKLFRRGEDMAALSLMLYGAMATVNYPLHLAFTAALGAWLMAYALVDSPREVTITKEIVNG